MFTLKDLEKLVNIHKGVEIPDTNITFIPKNEYDANGRYTTTLIPKYSDINSWAALATISAMHGAMGTQMVELSDAFGDKVDDVRDGTYAVLQRNHQIPSGMFDGFITAPQHFQHNVYVYRITKNPVEVTTDGITYRSLWEWNTLFTCVPDSNVTYKYLDKDMFFAQVMPRNSKKTHTVFFKELTLEVFLVLHLLSKLTVNAFKVLQDECFIPSKNIRLLVLALEKQHAALAPNDFIPEHADGHYIRHKNAMNKQFLGTAEQRVLGEFLEDKLPTIEKYGIKFTKTTAKYEDIVLGHPELLKIISNYGYVSWSKPFDIYELGGAIGHYVSRTLTNDAQTEFTINGMPIVVSKRQYRNSVNGYTINKDELVEVIRRGLCYDKVEDFNKLLASVSKMSLMNHDALGNGVLLPWRKLPETVTEQAHVSFYQRDKADKFKNMPRLRFKRVDGKIGIITDVEGKEHIVIRSFTGFIRSVKRMFNNVNWGYSRATGQWVCRDYKWAENELIALLRKHVSTAPTKTKNEDGTFTVVPSNPLITVEEARQILYAADTVTEKAVTRAKEFLATIVKKVEAEPAELHGAKGYKVKGKKHTYFVNGDTNQVYSFETGASICIVDAGHQVRVGNDELATRLMALKHDERTMSKIATLSGYVR